MTLTPTLTPLVTGPTPTPTHSGTPMPQITPTPTPYNPTINPIVPIPATSTPAPFNAPMNISTGYKSWSCAPVRGEYCCVYVGVGAGEFNDLPSCQSACSDSSCLYYNPPLCAGNCLWFSIVAGWVLMENNCLSGCACQIPDPASASLGIQYILTGCLDTNI
jgi:hypothetical protein